MPTPAGPFKAFRISQAPENDAKIAGAVVETTLDELTPGDVVIKATYSSVNYKDALAAGGAKIIRKYPVDWRHRRRRRRRVSADSRFRTATGGRHRPDLGVANDGSYAAVRVPADWIVKLPPSLTPFEAMALGRQDLPPRCRVRLEQNGLNLAGPVIVRAAGGVGSASPFSPARLK